MVSVLAFYSYDLSSNPAGYLNFLFEKTKINEREAGVGPFLEKSLGILCGRVLKWLLKGPPQYFLPHGAATMVRQKMANYCKEVISRTKTTRVERPGFESRGWHRKIFVVEFAIPGNSVHFLHLIIL